MSDDAHLICGFRLDGRGAGQTLDWPSVLEWSPGDPPIWIHLQATHEATERWLRDNSGLDPFIVDGLLASETRPRCDHYDDGILLILRGVNLNPGAEPEDMVSIRIWIDKDKVISTRLRRLMAVDDIRDQFSSGKGPVSTGHLVARLAARLTERMGPVIDDLSDKAADLETVLLSDNGSAQSDIRGIRFKLIDIRRIAISLRRYIAPQRDALNRLAQIDERWLEDKVRGRLRETVDRVTRITEQLDEVRERSAIIQDELVNRLSQRMERTMYVLTIVATVMLPLGFLTGLLGINVGGVPGLETWWAFWAVCAALAVLAVGEVWLLKRLKWL